MKVYIEIKSIRPDFMKVDYKGRTSNIWEKRKCFICGKNFKQSELVTAVFIEGKGNELSCSMCYQKNKKEWGQYIKGGAE